MSALPKAVQKQIAAANQLAEQLQNERLNPTPPTPVPAPAADSGAPAPAAAPANGEPAPNPAPAPAPADGWEQKYKVLQGKYNAEVPRLQRHVNEQADQLRLQQQQIVALQSMMASFNQNRGAAPGGTDPAPAAPAKLVKDEEVETFGADLTDFIRRVAQQTVMPQVEQRLQPVQQQVEQARSTAQHVAQRSQQTDQEKMLATLDVEVPNWREQNVDEAYLAWLRQPDLYSGIVRMDLLKQAYERADAPRVVAIFKGYRNEHAVVTPPTPATVPAGTPQRQLDEFVAPGSTKAGSTTGAQDGAGKRIWTEAEIKRFYDDCTAGRFAKKPDQRKQIENDIVMAAREGRVR